MRSTRKGHVSDYEIVVDPGREVWKISHTSDGTVEQRDVHGIYTVRVGRKTLESAPRDGDRVPPALWLVFPVSAFIWGRPRDNWRMVDAVRSSDLSEIRLVHLEHPDISATLTVDHSSRIAIKFVTPVESFELLDI